MTGHLCTPDQLPSQAAHSLMAKLCLREEGSMLFHISLHLKGIPDTIKTECLGLWIKQVIYVLVNGTVISKGPLGVWSYRVFPSNRLQSNNENAILIYLAFPADPRVAFTVYSAIKLPHKNNLFVKFLFLPLHTWIRGPRGGGMFGWGGMKGNPVDGLRQ